MNVYMWIKWAGRDLRQRWLQVLAIAMIIALGTGIYAGLGGQESWRLESNDQSYTMLNMYDMRLKMTHGSWLPQDDAVERLSQVPGVAAVEARLVLDTQVEVIDRVPSVLVVGQIVGVNIQAGGPHINQVHIDVGRGLAQNDSQGAVLEYKFARHHKLDPGVRLMLSGGFEVDVIGLGQIPDYFLVMSPGGFHFPMGEASFAAVVLPLEDVQKHYQLDGQINEVLFRLESQSDVQVVQAEIEAAAKLFAGTAFSITVPDDDPAYTMLYSDPVEDQEMLDFFAIILLAGASLAAFNLAGRIVEAQRRQIGICMALGVPKKWIAFRPLLMGLQIAFLGTALGLGLGFIFAWLLGDLTMSLMPLPYWSGTILHWPSFIEAALMGMALPLVATLIPVIHAVRMPTLEAIHGHLIARSSGLNRWLRGVQLPGNTFSQMPVKNILRSVRRAGLMMFGLVTVVILLTLFLGLLDTIFRTLDQTEAALLSSSPERLIVNMTGFLPLEHPNVKNIRSLTADDGRQLFEEVEIGLRLSGKLRSPGVHVEESISTLLEYFDPQSAIWMPAILDRGADAGRDRITEGIEIVIAQKMADDLGLAVGDTAILEHPKRIGLAEVTFEESEVVIAGIHDNPIRGFSYIDRTQEPFTGFEMMANVVTVQPAAGIDQETTRRILFTQPGVASVQTVREIGDILGEVLGLLAAMIRVIQGVVLIMAFLIAYNATTINMDDRQREIATMFAFGLNPRIALLVQIGENLILGLLSTLIGLGSGYLMLQYFMASRMESMFEGIGIVVSMSHFSLIMIVVLSTGLVALTPLVNIRRLKGINIPNALRVME